MQETLIKEKLQGGKSGSIFDEKRRQTVNLTRAMKQREARQKVVGITNSGQIMTAENVNPFGLQISRSRANI